MSTSLKVLRYLQFVDFLKSAGMILFAALVAFCLEWSEFLVVRHTSGLALAISGVVKVRIVTLNAWHVSCNISAFAGGADTVNSNSIA